MLIQLILLQKKLVTFLEFPLIQTKKAYDMYNGVIESIIINIPPTNEEEIRLCLTIKKVK